MAAGRENFIFFLCPLDGVRFTVVAEAARILDEYVAAHPPGAEQTAE